MKADNKASCMRVVVSIALVSLVGTASAQQADDASKTLGKVVVTGEQQKDVQERTELGKLTPATPISGAVVSQEQFEHLHLVNNLLELAKRVPGISMIRNMRIPDGGKLYTENRIDGMRATSTNTSALDEISSADIERIEVITGPASALYGSGALGGTISTYLLQPPREFAARVSQEAGSAGLFRSQGNIGTSTADGRFGFIVTGSKLDADGWRQSNAQAAKDAAEEHKDGVSFRGLVRPTDSTRIGFGLSSVKYDYRWAGPLNMARFGQDWRQTEAGTYGQYIDAYQTSSIRLQQLIGGSGELTLAFARTSDDQTNNGNGGSGGSNNVICDDTSALGPLAAGTTVKCRAVNANSATSTNTIKVAGSVVKTSVAMYRHDFALGKTTAYVGAEKVESRSDSTTFNNVFKARDAQSGAWSRGTISSLGSITDTNETTPFVHVEFSPLDKFRFHVGERFGKIDYRVDDRTATNRDIGMTRKGAVKRLGVTYDLDPTHLVWANWGETFNPQSTGSLVNSATVGTAGNVIGAVLTPERGVTKEIGFRGRFDKAALQYDVTLYHANTNGFNTTRNCTAAEQASFNAGAACTMNEAAGRLATRGVESMLNWEAAKWLDLGATYTHSEAYFTDFKTTATDFTGKYYQAMPKHKLNLRAGFKPAPGWLVELEGDYISSYFVDNTNLQGTYTRPILYSLRSSYKQNNWSFWAHVINLTDREYATRVQLSTIAGQSNVLSSQAGHGNAGSYAPRTLRVGVSYNF